MRPPPSPPTLHRSSAHAATRGRIAIVAMSAPGEERVISRAPASRTVSNGGRVGTTAPIAPPTLHNATLAAADATRDAHARSMTCRQTWDRMFSSGTWPRHCGAYRLRCGRDAPLIGERAATRGRIATEGGDDRSHVKGAIRCAPASRPGSHGGNPDASAAARPTEAPMPKRVTEPRTPKRVTEPITRLSRPVSCPAPP
jgi:hypothetical protein